jgi:hypothetical protein
VIPNVPLCEMNCVAIVPANEFFELDTPAVFRDLAQAVRFHARNLGEFRTTRNLVFGLGHNRKAPGIISRAQTADKVIAFGGGLLIHWCIIRKPLPQPTALEIVSLDGLVPKDHLLRKIDAVIDFSFIHDRVAGGFIARTTGVRRLIRR